MRSSVWTVHSSYSTQSTEPLLRVGPDRKEIIGAEKNEQLRLDTIHQISFHLTHPLIKPLPSHREQTKTTKNSPLFFEKLYKKFIII